MKTKETAEIKVKTKRKSKGVATHIRRLKQDARNGTIIATPKKKVDAKIVQEKA